MIALLQRVSKASVTINHDEKRTIGHGLLIFLGITENDGHQDIDWLTSKITNLRIFDDDNGVMNQSVLDVKGEMMVISQFTLHASTKKGNRPSYSKASPPEVARPLYEAFVEKLKSTSELTIMTGTFGAYMEVALVNDGPVTIIIDTKDKK